MSDITITTPTDGLGQSSGGPSNVIGADGSYMPPGVNGTVWVEGDAQRQLYDIRNRTPEQVATIQKTLEEAGILRSEYARGRINPATIGAYEEVLRISNSEGRAPEAILQEMSMANFARNLGANVARAGDRIAGAMSAGPSRAPFTARVSNPADLRRFFRQAVINATGEFKGQVDIDKMVEAYQATERNAQAAAYNAAPSGGTVEDAMSPDAFVEEALAESVPEEVQTRNVVDRAGELFGMLGSFGGMSQ